MKKRFTFLILTFFVLTIGAQSCPDDNHPHLIDLGLPSGTLWACCNIDSDPTKQTPTNYGGYYAWGEMEEKEKYDPSTYIHCDGSIKTCHDLGSDISGTQYDVAYMKWGGSWVMPSLDQIKELLNNCYHEWTRVNNLNGLIFTSKKNGGSIFLPAQGYRYRDSYNNASIYGYYWSSTQNPSNSSEAYFLYISSDVSDCGTYYRTRGQAIRPVMSNTNSINLVFSSEIYIKAIYNIYGIKVANNFTDMNNLPPGIYIVNGKKYVIK